MKKENEALAAIDSAPRTKNGRWLRTGVLDIETTGLFAEFGYILVAIVKDIDTDEYKIFRLDYTKTYKSTKNRNTPQFWRRIDRELLQELHKAYSDFDIIIHFNGRNFDIKFINTRCIKNNLPVLPDMKQLDIMQICRYRLRLRSTALHSIKEFLEIDEKDGGHKWEYWQMAANGQKAGFEHVVKHCIQDVDRIGSVAKRIKAYINFIKK